MDIELVMSTGDFILACTVSLGIGMLVCLAILGRLD